MMSKRLFSLLNKIAPRGLTDYYVKTFMNIPMKIGGGEKPEFEDYNTLTNNSLTYASDEVVRWYDEDFEKIKTQTINRVNARDRVFFSSLSVLFSEYDQCNIVDFGGSNGSDYFKLKNVVGLNRVHKYYICENEKVVNHFNQKIASEPKLKFVSKLSEIPKSDPIHYVYLSGTLQYLEDPIFILKEILSYDIQYIFINRSPMWDKPQRLTKQLRPRYKDEKERFSYPCWILNSDQISSVITEHGYSLCEFHCPYDRPYITGYGLLPYKSFFFKKDDKQKDNA